jgi:peptidoglycan/xylan/chitin deacetylase (PgdA/CDA1 family)
MNLEKSKICLTFDDGPNEYTLKNLETLKKFNLKATFFVVGKNCQKFPQILKEIVKEGHSIGNHSFSHSIKFFFDFKREIERTNQIIKEITGIETKIFRPPYGFLHPLLKNYLLKNGYKILFWDVDSRDWRGKIDQKIFQKIKPNSILLFHDYLETSLALPKILEDLKRKSFVFQKL